jgi:transposase
MLKCKKCNSTSYVKNGLKRNKQNYKCKDCGCNFVFGDQRKKVSTEHKALAVLLYGRCKSSYGFISKLLNVSRVTVMRWLKKFGDNLPDPEIPFSIKDVSFDEMWHFIDKKKGSYGSGERWTGMEIELSDGLLGIVLVRHLGNFSKDLSI